MEDLSHDFDVLAERADDCGALWAVRMLYRLVSAGNALPTAWPGTETEARRLVETFAERVGFAARENLTSILQHSAELTWAESLDRIRSAPPSMPAIDHRPFSSISWHLDKLSLS
jgi:hypothetical protein